MEKLASLLTINGLVPTYAFRKCSEPFESTRFLTFESQLKKIKLFNPPFTCNLSPKHV